ncbi:unnamed protein product [Haemonchus placei]|uniref:ZP domain-containing protein n=1 Tax=Haemonchus placei TaxID=6290 RepID=A0A0N4WQT9_HAEPC|nr:unnamed protein product [Haemonchus placei]
MVRVYTQKLASYNVYVPGTVVESIDLNCDAVLTGGREFQKYKYWDFQYHFIENELFHSGNICATIQKYFVFQNEPLSKEEADYPLSYGFLIYRDIVQCDCIDEFPIVKTVEREAMDVERLGKNWTPRQKASDHTAVLFKSHGLFLDCEVMERTRAPKTTCCRAPFHFAQARQLPHSATAI